jgi:hypothetical protein
MNININSSLTKEQLININKAYITYFKRITKNPTNILELTRNENTFPIEYTFEEIQNKKREQFNEELNKKQKEFSSFNQIVIPPPLKFNEDIDKPISEMEQLIAKTIAGRGVSFMEGKVEWHYMPQTDEQHRQALDEVGKQLQTARAK